MPENINKKSLVILNFLYKYRQLENANTIAKILDMDSRSVSQSLKYLHGRGLIEIQENCIAITVRGDKFIDEYFSNVLKHKVKDKKALEDLIYEFKGLDYHFKTIIMRWQVRADSQKRLLEFLEKINEEVKTKIISKLVDYIPWIQEYGRRLDLALERVRQGDTLYLVKDRGSYYNTWYEMKDDIYRLGRLFKIDLRPVVVPW